VGSRVFGWEVRGKETKDRGGLVISKWTCGPINLVGSSIRVDFVGFGQPSLHCFRKATETRISTGSLVYHHKLKASAAIARWI
jgi:hypothetical protein